MTLSGWTCGGQRVSEHVPDRHGSWAGHWYCFIAPLRFWPQFPSTVSEDGLSAQSQSTTMQASVLTVHVLRVQAEIANPFYALPGAALLCPV